MLQVLDHIAGSKPKKPGEKHRELLLRTSRTSGGMKRSVSSLVMPCCVREAMKGSSRSNSKNSKRMCSSSLVKLHLMDGMMLVEEKGNQLKQKLILLVFKKVGEVGLDI